jgi:hypothetical protein
MYPRLFTFIIEMQENSYKIKNTSMQGTKESLLVLPGLQHTENFMNCPSPDVNVPVYK